jgi:hypothetical protein
MSDNELDNLFKEAAQEFKAPQDASAWKDMSNRLDQAGIGTSAFWNWKTISTMTAVGVTSVALIWYSIQPVKEQSLQEVASSQSVQGGLVVDQSNSLGTEMPTEVKSSKESEAIKLEETKSINRNANKPVQKEQKNITTKAEIDNAKVGIQSDLKVSDEDLLSNSDSNEKNPGVGKLSKADNQASQEKVIVSSIAPATQRVVPLGAEIKILTSTNNPEERGISSEPNQSVTQPANINTANNTDDPKMVVSNIKAEGMNADRAISLSNRDAFKKIGSEGNGKSLSEGTDSLVKSVDTLNNVPDETLKKEVLTAEPKEEEKIKKSSVFAVKLAVAPDFSSINFFTAGKPGFNYGLMIGYSFNNRWSVYAGAISSRKIYSSSEIDKPYTSSGYDYEVMKLDGDCRVLDIPINVYYTFFPEKSFSIKAGVGISSYLMISEDYTYHVDNQYGGPPEYNQNIDRKNNEWFKVMNVSVILQKRLNNQFSLELEPFLKAPLTGVGEGEVSLVSLGAFLNVRFDIPIKKQ